MSQPIFNPADAEFLGSADITMPPGYSRWRDATSGETWVLSPADVQRHGLVEKMREALTQTPAQEGPVVAQEGPREATDVSPSTQARTPGIEVLGGHTEDWRWERVLDGDDVLWVIDNKPALERARQQLRRGDCPDRVELQRVVLPQRVLDAIMGRIDA